MPELIVPPGLICGIDEAGRGPLAGTVVAAAVILDPARPIAGLNDSKKLTEAARKRLAVEIREKALAWGISFCVTCSEPACCCTWWTRRRLTKVLIRSFKPRRSSPSW